MDRHIFMFAIRGWPPRITGTTFEERLMKRYAVTGTKTL
jgi:hypothetical protein